jgi:hypothetical protein
MMYGNKQQPSSFEIYEFIEYAKGNYRFPEFPPLRRYKVKSRKEIAFSAKLLELKSRFPETLEKVVPLGPSAFHLLPNLSCGLA